MLRKTFFWLHLLAGLICGLVIAVMAFTGTTLAFEKELVAWAERDARQVVPPPGAMRLPLSEILQRARDAVPDFKLAGVSVSADPVAAVPVTFGRDDLYFVNPYTGEVRQPASRRVRDFLKFTESVHRQLALTSDARKPLGRAVTGACSTAFLFLATSGLFLWWPRNWSWRGFKSTAVVNVRLAGKARDFNWHNAIGFWSAPFLILTTVCALPMSYRWANNLLYTATDNELPTAGAGGTAIVVPTPTAGSKPLGHDALLTAAQRECPNWSYISFRFGVGRGQGGPGRKESTGGANENRAPQAVSVMVQIREQWPFFASTMLSLDPFTGAVLQREPFGDQNAGRRLRLWARYLHTGEALGWFGRIATFGAAFGALILVWTGIALAWRRFMARKQEA